MLVEMMYLLTRVTMPVIRCVETIDELPRTCTEVLLTVPPMTSRLETRSLRFFRFRISDGLSVACFENLQGRIPVYMDLV